MSIVPARKRPAGSHLPSLKRLLAGSVTEARTVCLGGSRLECQKRCAGGDEQSPIFAWGQTAGHFIQLDESIFILTMIVDAFLQNVYPVKCSGFGIPGGAFAKCGFRIVDDFESALEPISFVEDEGGGAGKRQGEAENGQEGERMAFAGQADVHAVEGCYQMSAG